MTDGERLEQQSGEERESRVSFGEVLRDVSAPPPIPGKYTLAPPDAVPVADELSQAPRRSLVDRLRDHDRVLKRGAIAFAMGFGLVLGLIPSRPVDPAPSGTFSEAELSAEVMPIAAADDGGHDHAPSDESVERVMREGAPDPVPHVIRLAPIELVVAPPEERAPEHAPERVQTTPEAEQARRVAAPLESHGKTGEAPSSVDAVAGSSEPRSTEVEPAQAEPRDLPATPAREDVAEAMARVHQAVRDCAPGYAGSTVQVRTTFLSSGAVTTAVVDGALAGTTEGSCVARAVREARLPEFQQDTFVVAYPFAL